MTGPAVLVSGSASVVGRLHPSTVARAAPEVADGSRAFDASTGRLDEVRSFSYAPLWNELAQDPLEVVARQPGHRDATLLALDGALGSLPASAWSAPGTSGTFAAELQARRGDRAGAAATGAGIAVLGAGATSAASGGAGASAVPVRRTRRRAGIDITEATLGTRKMLRIARSLSSGIDDEIDWALGELCTVSKHSPLAAIAVPGLLEALSRVLAVEASVVGVPGAGLPVRPIVHRESAPVYDAVAGVPGPIFAGPGLPLDPCLEVTPMVAAVACEEASVSTGASSAAAVAAAAAASVGSAGAPAHPINNFVATPRASSAQAPQPFPVAADVRMATATKARGRKKMMRPVDDDAVASGGADRDAGPYVTQAVIPAAAPALVPESPAAAPGSAVAPGAGGGASAPGFGSTANPAANDPAASTHPASAASASAAGMAGMAGYPAGAGGRDSAVPPAAPLGGNSAAVSVTYIKNMTATQRKRALDGDASRLSARFTAVLHRTLLEGLRDGGTGCVDLLRADLDGLGGAHRATVRARGIRARARLALAAAAVHNLALEESRGAMCLCAERGLAAALTAVMRCADLDLFLDAANALAQMAKNMSVYEPSGREVFAVMLAAAMSNADEVCLVGLRGVANFALSDDNERVIMSCERAVLRAALPLLDHPDRQIRLAALEVVFNLSYFGRALPTIIAADPAAAMGVIRMLHPAQGPAGSSFVDPARDDARRMAALTLANLAPSGCVRSVLVPHADTLIDMMMTKDGGDGVSSIVARVVADLDLGR